MTGTRTESLDISSLAWRNTEDQSEKDAVSQDSGVTLTDNFTYPPHMPVLGACSPPADVDSYQLNHYPGDQLPSHEAENISTPQKRKYQVTTMGDSPLKLRISWPGTRSFALDSSGRDSSSWDALAGEEPYSDDSGSVPDICAVPARQHATSAIQTAFRRPSPRQGDPSMLHPGDELYEVLPLLSSSPRLTNYLQVAIRPFLSQPDERLFEIYQGLCHLGLDPIENSTRFGFK